MPFFRGRVTVSLAAVLCSIPGMMERCSPSIVWNLLFDPIDTAKGLFANLQNIKTAVS